MKNGFFLILLLFLCGGAAGAESWSDPDAAYRLTIRQNGSKTGGSDCFLLSDYLLPEPLTNGARAFLASGEEVPLEWEESGRAILIPSSAAERELQIYGGYARMQNSPQPFRPDSRKYNMLTMQEVENWRLHGNFQEYLERRRQEFQRRVRMQYDNFQKQLIRHRLSSFLSPPATGRTIPAGYWELNSNWVTDHPGNYQYNLYQSKVLMRHQEWRLFQRVPLKAFLPDPNLYKNRNWWELDSLFRQRERTENDWKTALASDRNKLIFGELTDRFESRLTHRSPAPRFPSQFKFFHHELDLRGTAVLRYTGNLRMDRSAICEFEVTTNSLWIMEIDGKTAARKMLDPDTKKKHRHRFSQILDFGLHSFTFYYARCDSKLDFQVRIKMPSGDWKVLDDSMFAPAPSGELLAVSMRDGKEFPVIRRFREGAFMTGKRSYCQLERLEVPKSLRWHYEGREVPLSASQFFALSPESAGTFLLHYRGNSFQLPKIEKTVSPVILKGTLSMELRVPPFVYDDETTTVTAVIRNESSLTLPMILTIRTQTDDASFMERLESVSVSPGITFKPIPVSAADCAVDVELSIPGYSFGGDGVRIISAARIPAAPDLAHDRLTEPETGRRYCIVIHRTTLSELRTWELLRLLNDKSPDRLLVLGTSEELSKRISARWPDRTPAVEQYEWPPEPVNGESRLLRGLGGVLERIRGGGCDSIVLIPPESDIPLLGEEEFCRYLSVIADTAKENKAIRRIYLVVPDGKEANRNPRLLRFAREYGMELL